MYFHRTLLAALAAPASAGKVRLLFGARQTGKTMLLRRLVAGGESAFIDLQDSATRRRFESDPARFGREVRALPARVRTIVVDEVQKVPALLEEVQSLYDAGPAARAFVLTGSSARRLIRGSANLLPGRSHVFHLAPVTRWEQGVAPALDVLSEPATPTSRKRAASRATRTRPRPEAPPFVRQSLARTLLFGSLPGIMQESTETAALTLAAYVGIYLEEEIRSEALVRDLGGFSEFLRLAALESGRVVNLTKLSHETGIALSTLKNFYQVLEQTFVGLPVRAYGRAGRKRLLTTPRFYLFDNGVRTAAAGLSFDAASLEGLGGDLLKHWVGLELLHRTAYLGRGFGVSFWRTVSGAEVDFVLETPREDVPIEVKWTRRPTPADARHIETFLDTYPARAKRGFVVCRTEAREQLTHRVTAIPWSEW